MKENIKPIQEEIDINLILGLEGKSFNYIGQPETCFGFIAEELADVEPKLVIYKDGQPHAIQYDQFIPIIVEYLKGLQVPQALVQEQPVQEKFEQVVDYSKDIAELNVCISVLENNLADVKDDLKSEIAMIEESFNDANIPALNKRIDYLDKKLSAHTHEKELIKIPETVYSTPKMLYVFIGISILTSLISLLMR